MERDIRAIQVDTTYGKVTFPIAEEYGMSPLYVAFAMFDVYAVIFNKNVVAGKSPSKIRSEFRKFIYKDTYFRDFNITEIMKSLYYIFLPSLKRDTTNMLESRFKCILDMFGLGTSESDIQSMKKLWRNISPMYRELINSNED